MNLHIHIGPANHQKILLNQLQNKGVSHSWSNYFPKFNFGNYNPDNGSKEISIKQNYDLINKIVWGLRSRIPYLRKSNWHRDVTFPIYDKTVANFITENTLLFAWPMVAKQVIKKVNALNGISILDYPIAHITSWQRMLKEEAQIAGAKEIPRSLFTPRMEDYMLEEIENANYINVPSLFVRDSFLANGVSEEKLLLNNYGIDASRFFPSANKNAKFSIVFVGSVELRKGVHYLVQAFKKLNLIDAQLLIIGDIKDDFRNCFPEYLNVNNVKWLGSCTPERTASEMRNAHVLVMPSVMEGLSLTILEAQASGLPVISSENAGGKDVIEDGINGYIFKNRDVNMLAEKILKIYEDKDWYQFMSESSLKIFHEKFTSDAYGTRIINMFESFQ